MCLIIKKDQEMLIADRNIPAFKTLDEQNSSINFSFDYIKGEVTERIELYKKSPIWWALYGADAINKGYHSRIVSNSSLKEYQKSHLFVIPKGAAYYIGGENVIDKEDGYVSSTIIFVGKNTWFNRLMAYLKYGVVYK